MIKVTKILLFSTLSDCPKVPCEMGLKGYCLVAALRGNYYMVKLLRIK